MAEQNPQGYGGESDTKAQVEGRRNFDCFGKKEDEKSGEDAAMTDLETMPVTEAKKDKHTLMEELHRSCSNSSSSSDEEEVEGGEKKMTKKKELKEKIKEKMSGEKEDGVDEQKTTLKMFDYQGGNAEATKEEAEKKGFLEKIKEKLPGQHKKPEEEENSPKEVMKEKKGILEKIKDKLPGHHKNDEDEMKEKEN